MVSIDIVYEGNLICRAQHGPSGKFLSTDAPVDNGGKGAEFSPTALVATALGSCLLPIIGLVAQRNQLDIRGAKVHVEKEMASSPNRRIGSLKTIVAFPPGNNLSLDDRKKLENAAKLCPVKQSLHPDVQIDIEFVYPE